ncbi:MAG: hypothetical protein KDC87_16645 [Planctomycetes bacterium]|nr:hypothetical protein [Planctomycetota bacterium]
MGHFELRTAAEDDWAGIADGFARATGGDASRIRQHIACALRDNPHGSSSVLAAAPDGRIVAHLGVTHVPMLVSGSPLLFGRLHGCFIEPAYRTGGVHGLFAALYDVFQTTFEIRERLAAVFGQWDEVDWWHMRRTFGHDAVATSIDLHRPAIRPVLELVGEGAVITRDGDGSVSARCLDVGSCGVRRSGEFDAWRAVAPGRSDRIWQAWQAGERTGMAITRDAGGVRWILDWAVRPQDSESVRALLHAVIVDACTPVHTRFWTSDVFTLSLFQEAGFEVVAGPEAYLAIHPVLPHIHHLWLSEHWHVTLADAGLRAMPRLTIGEPVVHPPSPGTSGARKRNGE